MSDRRVVFGVKPILELISARARDVSVIYIMDGDPGAALKELAVKAAGLGITVENRTRLELDALCSTQKHQGAAAITGPFQYADLDSLCDAAEGRAPLILVLDGIQDPGNLGALIRSAHVLGANGVVIPRDRAASITAAVVKTSAGATEHTKIAQVVNVVRAAEELKERGLWIVGTALGEARPSMPWQVDFTAPTAIVVGAEGKGIRPLVARTCDIRVEIPMAGQVTSLNASVAGGVLLYEAARQRAKKG